VFGRRRQLSRSSIGSDDNRSRSCLYAGTWGAVGYIVVAGDDNEDDDKLRNLNVRQVAPCISKAPGDKQQASEEEVLESQQNKTRKECQRSVRLDFIRKYGRGW